VVAGNRRKRRYFELLLVLGLAAVLVVVMNSRKSDPPPQPVKPLTAEQRADAETFFEEVKFVGTAVIEEAPKAVVENLKREQPYQVYRDLSEIKKAMETLAELQLESERLEEELAALEESDSDSLRQAEIEVYLDAINEELSEILERVEDL
jgi:FtsZ-binding cell division protein ZapB